MLADELEALGARELRQTVAGVQASGDLTFAYRCCLWSRLANRVLLPLARFPAPDAEALYAGIQQLKWEDHLRSDGTLWIEFNGMHSGLRNTQFSAQKVKDAIVDRLRTPDGQRPSIRRDKPDLLVNVRLSKQQAVVNIDLSGESLHKRGYRVDSVVAPLKENLAAALLIRSGWPSIMKQGGALIDPMCGSGTLLIEAAMMAADMAPGIWRDDFGFLRWLQHDSRAWEELCTEAQQRRERGLAGDLPEIRGYDEQVLALRAAERNVAAAGVDDFVRVMRKPLQDFRRPTHRQLEQGLVITNPPYGERLGEHEKLVPLYRHLGGVLRSEFINWQAAVFTGNPELGKQMGLRAGKQYKLFNGSIPSVLLLFDVSEAIFVDQREVQIDPAGELSEGAQMLANRLKKNRRQLDKVFQGRGINCYRIYDADLPEYASAIDIYGDHLHIQEYAAPKSVDPRRAERRLLETQQAVASVFQVTADKISVKQRRRNPGRQQYEKLQDDPFEQLLVVEEGPARFNVNLWAYLDSGVFLDHRLVRQKVAELSAGKRLLNLFCYTATATVQAAIAGASSSVSVDMSRTYLLWARKNFQLNRLSSRHELVQADCLEWLWSCREAFDVILLDPPSFSNSKRMTDVLDVQRDHVKLIRRCMELLNPGGTLVFSTNLKRFKLDREQLTDIHLVDISKSTIDLDYQRRPDIHQCFLVSAK